MTRESTLEYTAIRDQFHKLANLINEPITVFLIGSGALTLQELKNATKDIDFIVREDLHQL
ncbi:hypothetical protein NKF06_05370 [Haloferax sp. AB510]|uniref:hypothetical protein n=1 Tax=Haloferax sp. AB510 TaxID=2934172 RepID=UPI00209C1270|nr:hypothetical protein [Haloferax sp. AB510]MCO8266027.1 hypothetical protein [Haloferax sp. AB510]